MKNKINFINWEAMKKLSKERLAMVGLSFVLITSGLTGCGKENKEEAENQYNGVYISEDDSFVEFEQDSSNMSLGVLRDNGENVSSVYFDNSYYIDDLSNLNELCPNLETLVIDKCPSVYDLSFIYKCSNLKKVEITENAFVTSSLVDFLDGNGIEHNITEDDLKLSEEVDKIIAEIIKPEMSDEEKIQAVTSYVIDNYKYKKKLVHVSNENPLSSMLENKAGVCAGYAYLTNVLLRKAGIESYEIAYHGLIGHGWNLVEMEGKYYYIDATNIDVIPVLSNIILKKLNVGFYYMSDPEANLFSAMKDFDNKKVVIPAELIEDIEKGQDTKNLLEKYGNSFSARFIELLIIIIGIGAGIKLTMNGISNLNDSRRWKKR